MVAEGTRLLSALEAERHRKGGGGWIFLCSLLYRVVVCRHAFLVAQRPCGTLFSQSPFWSYAFGHVCAFVCCLLSFVSCPIDGCHLTAACFPFDSIRRGRSRALKTEIGSCRSSRGLVSHDTLSEDASWRVVTSTRRQRHDAAHLVTPPVPPACSAPFCRHIIFDGPSSSWRGKQTGGARGGQHVPMCVGTRTLFPSSM